MAFEDVLNVFRSSGLPPTQRLVAAVLAVHRNPASGQCDPSIETIVQETGLCERAVRMALRAMEESGTLLSSKSQFSIRGRRQYTLLFLSGNSPPVNVFQDGATGARDAGVTGACDAPLQGHVMPGSESEGGISFPPGGHLVPEMGACDAPERKGKVKKDNRGGGGGEFSIPEKPVRSKPGFGSAELLQANAVLLFDGAPDELRDLWTEWQRYRTARATTGPASRRLPWTEQAARMSAGQIESALTSHPAPVVADRIRAAIAGNWQGLNLDKLETRPASAPRPQLDSRPSSNPVLKAAFA